MYENTDYIKMELTVVLMNKKGEIEFESTKTETYTNSWSSENKVKRTKPTYKRISQLASKLTSNALYELVNKKAEMMSKGFLTVVEVGNKVIYIDLGENNNIEEGDEFPVYKEPTVKTIKRTGKTRLSYGDKIATAKIDGIFDDGAEAIIIKGNIKDIHEGYVLRLKRKRGNR